MPNTQNSEPDVLIDSVISSTYPKENTLDLFRQSLLKNHRWNAIWIIIDGNFFYMFYAFSMPSIIIAAFLMHYTKSQFILNLPIFITNFSFALFPFIMGFFSGKLQRKKRWF